MRAFRVGGDVINGGFFAFDPSLTSGLAAAVTADGIAVVTRGAPTLLRVVPMSTLTASP